MMMIPKEPLACLLELLLGLLMMMTGPKLPESSSQQFRQRNVQQTGRRGGDVVGGPTAISWGQK